MSFTIKNNYQWQPPSSGIKHLKIEECEYFQITSRPNTQYQSILPKTITKYIILAHGMKMKLNGLVKPLFREIWITSTHVFLEYNTSSLKTQSMM